MAVADSVSDAWRVAADDLQHENGETTCVAALVHDFGARAGTLAGMLHDDFAVLSALAKPLGQYVSLLNPDSYCRYERQQFIDTLNDRGWYGGDAPPPWYTGEPWTP